MNSKPEERFLSTHGSNANTDRELTKYACRFYLGLVDYHKVNSKVPLSRTAKSRLLSTKISTMMIDDNDPSKFKEIFHAIGLKINQKKTT